jgi:glycosyltransferase involved in cell wall biosynthesis
MPGKILFLVPYPLKESPSQRFRFEQYFNLLEHHNHRYKVQSFLNSQNWQLFFKPGNDFSKALALAGGFIKRILILFEAPAYDFVFIHREITPVGPPVFEWIIAKILKRKIIYDFDDMIWLTDRQNESILLRVAKWRSKVRSICYWAYRVSCGNNYLCNFAYHINPGTRLNPTTVDTENWHSPDLYPVIKDDTRIILGWTGSHSTLKYLTEIEDILQKVEQEYPMVRIRIIADQKPSLQLQTLEFIPWNVKTEVQDLLQFDIGLMPLPDNEWAKGKCGFKIIQYLSLGIPAIASPVGVNADIIQDGVTGFLCHSSEAWFKAIKTLIEDKNLRRAFGERGREFIQRTYSTASNSSNFLKLFEES